MPKDGLEIAVKRNFEYSLPSLKDVFRIGDLGHFDSTCQETVPAALRCFIDANNFEETLRNAVMAKGDTDTKAAIACSLAEACYEIPEYIIDRAYSYLPHDILTVMEQFYEYIQKNVND